MRKLRSRTQCIELITQLMRDGQHNDTLIVAAEYTMQDDFVATYETYKRQQSALGYMPDYVIAQRNKDVDELITTIGMMYGDDEFAVFGDLLRPITQAPAMTCAQ